MAAENLGKRADARDGLEALGRVQRRDRLHALVQFAEFHEDALVVIDAFGRVGILH